MGLSLAPPNSCRSAAANTSRISNYCNDAGAGSQIITNLSEGPRWRGALLGTVAAGALWFYAPRTAKAGPDACVTVGTTAFCQGDQSDGISSNADFNPAVVNTLEVYDLTTDIMPAAGVDGIYFHRTGAGNYIVIFSDTTDVGPYAIIVTGAGADGIDAQAAAAITIDHQGYIASEDGRGISAARPAVPSR